MRAKENTISVIQTLDRIKELIEKEQGDPGRLRYIYEFVERGKSLYQSDQQYLEKKIQATIIFESPRPPSKQEEQARSIEKLLEWNIGFPERLRFMLNYLRKGKHLFDSDEKYLENKLRDVPQKLKKQRAMGLRSILPDKIPKIEELPPKVHPSQSISKKISEAIPSKIHDELKIANKKIEKLEKELSESKDSMMLLVNTLKIKNKELEEKNSEIHKLTSEYAKMVSYTSLENIELDKLKQKILDENEKMDMQKLMSEQIKKEREKLEQLIEYRKEYENRVAREKEIFEKQIKIETQKISEKDKIIEDIIKKQEQGEQNRIEREIMLKQVKEEQLRLEKEINKQKQELEKTKSDYKDIFDKLSKQEDSELVKKRMVSLALKNALLKIGIPEYDKIISLLEKKYGHTLEECYNNPEHLTNILRELFVDSYDDIISSLGKNMRKTSAHQDIDDFLQRLNP